MRKEGSDEDEVGSDTDEGERLGERDTDVHQDLETAGQLRLTGDALDGLADDDTHADGRADGGEAVTDGGDVAVDCSDVHCVFPSVMAIRAGARIVLSVPRRLPAECRQR